MAHTRDLGHKWDQLWSAERRSPPCLLFGLAPMTRGHEKPPNLVGGKVAFLLSAIAPSLGPEFRTKRAGSVQSLHSPLHHIFGMSEGAPPAHSSIILPSADGAGKPHNVSVSRDPRRQ